MPISRRNCASRARAARNWPKISRAPEADALEQKIDSLLLVARAKELDVKVDADITRRIAQVQAQSGIADPDKFHQWVFEQSGMTLRRLETADDRSAN